MVRGFTVCGVPGAKPRAVLPNSVQFDAASGEKMATDCRFRSFRSTMLHLRARGFAPVTMRLPEGLAKELLRRFGIAFGREQEVDRLAVAVDRPVQVGPAALHLHIVLTPPPRAVAQPQVRPDPLLDLRRVGLDPA